MGQSLTLLVLMGPEQIVLTNVHWHDRLHFDNCSDEGIFEQFIQFKDKPKPNIKAVPIPPQFWINIPSEKGYERTRQDAHLQELTFAYAKELKKLTLPDNAYYRNKAIKAYIDQLNDDVPVILYWH